MQTISSTARRRVVNRKIKIVAAEEPVESAPRLLVPVLVARDPMRFEASGHHGLSFHRLLIEAGAFTAAAVTFYAVDRQGTEAKVHYEGSDVLTAGQLSKAAESGAEISVAGHYCGDQFKANQVYLPAY